MTLNIDFWKLFDLLKTRIGEEPAKELVKAIEQTNEATKKMESNFDNRFEQIRTELKVDLARFATKDDIIMLQREMSSNMKWIIGTVIAAVGILIAVIKL